MKLVDEKIDSLELGFDIPQPGVSLCQFQEGIQKRTNENSGKTTLHLPMIIDQTIDGPETNEGLKMTHFCPIETPTGEKQLAAILSMTDLMEPFIEKFGDEIDIADDKLINGLKLKLPGKFIVVHHSIRQDNKGRDQTNIDKFERQGAGKKKDKPVAKQTQTEDENW